MQNILSLNSINLIIKNEPKFRLDQILNAWFSCKIKAFSEINTIHKSLRLELSHNLSWTNIKDSIIQKSKDNKTFKARLILSDDNITETVLMHNKKNQLTICVSSQIGCPLNCSFCGTGKMGFIRNLYDLEIAEQYLFWKRFLITNNIEKRISNIVFMGMGEPLLNYDNVKNALNLIIKYTDVGPNYCTISTAGIINKMNDFLFDTEWPKIKFAISLHSAKDDVRKSLVPSHTNNFFNDLKSWCIKYLELHGARTRYLTFEYVLIKNITDTKEEAIYLVNFLKGLNRIKVNLIPFNDINNDLYKPSNPLSIISFQNILKKNKITVTVRKSEGDKIKAACGQLTNLDLKISNAYKMVQ